MSLGALAKIGLDYGDDDFEELEKTSAIKDDKKTLEPCNFVDGDINGGRVLINNNQTDELIKVHDGQCVPNEKLQISDSQNGEAKVAVDAGQTTAQCDDVGYVLSMVQDNIKGIEISSNTPCCTAKIENLVDMKSSDTSDSSSESDSSSSSELFSDSDSESEEKPIFTTEEAEEIGLEEGPHRTNNEIAFFNIPVEPLDIFVDENVKLRPLGKIESIICKDAVVIINSFENVPAIDSNSILFLGNRSGFGRVFDIFGKVQSPHYCVKFNDEAEIKSTNVEIGDTVYFAPDTEDLTNFVFVSKLKCEKGTDASWHNDQEPPAEVLDYSDDEKESQAKAATKMAKSRTNRNEVHKQEEDTSDAAPVVKVEKLNPSACQTPPMQRDSQRGQFEPQSQLFCQLPPRLPPRLRIPPQSNPRGPPLHPRGISPYPRVPLPYPRVPPANHTGIPPRFGDQYVPFPPPIRGPYHEIWPHRPPQFMNEGPNLPPPIMPLVPPGPPRPQFGLPVEPSPYRPQAEDSELLPPGTEPF